MILSKFNNTIFVVLIIGNIIVKMKSSQCLLPALLTILALSAFGSAVSIGVCHNSLIATLFGPLD